MKVLASISILLVFICQSFAFPADSVLAKLPAPRVSADSWVLIEVWPEVKDITLAAYFLDSSEKKNQNLCAAAKRVFDSDQETKSKASGKKLSSYRLCLSIGEATARGYIHGA